MSLKAIAKQELARLKAGETTHETERETRLQQVKQPHSCFIDASARFVPMKQDQDRETANNGPCFTVSFPRGGTHETELPHGVTAGLRRLNVMRPPRLLKPDAWPVAVSDALRLARDGWAAKALALGWHELDLFGAVPDPRGRPCGRRDGRMAQWSGAVGDHGTVRCCR